jgi:hypothetical protein
VEIKDDSHGAFRLQPAFSAAALRTPQIKAPPAVPMFDNKNLIGVELFDDANADLSSVLDATQSMSTGAVHEESHLRNVGPYLRGGISGRTAILRR